MRPHAKTNSAESTSDRVSARRSASRAALTLATATLALLAIVPSALASQQVVDFIGGNGNSGGQFVGDSNGVAVNNTGAGPASQGDVYAVDRNANRVQRFGRDDNGTPVDSADDSYFFISAWGADVDSNPSGGNDYEVCTVAVECKAAVASGDSGAFNDPAGIAVDQDTGNVYVADASNFRINVYDGVGVFLRSFGWDVVASGPGDAGSAYEICVANADVCKAAVGGGGTGQLGFTESTRAGIAVSQPDGNPATGTVFVADSVNHRVDTFALDGSSPADFGSTTFSAFGFGVSHPTDIAVDSRGIVYASNSLTEFFTFTNHIERYDSENANGGGVGFLDPLTGPINEGQKLTIKATAGQFRLTFGGDTTADLPFNATDAEVQSALQSLPSIGEQNINVRGGPNNTSGTILFDQYIISFKGTLGAADVSQLVLSNGTTPLTGGVAGVTTLIDGAVGGPLTPFFGAAAPGGIAIDPGPGPATDTLYVFRDDSIQQFGPANSPGLSAPPTATDDTHATSPKFAGGIGDVAVDSATGRLLVTGSGLSTGFSSRGVYVLGDATNPSPPTASLDSISGVTPHSATVHATIDPNGLPDTSYHFEYSTDGSKWTSLPTVVLGHQESPQAVEAVLDKPPFGLLQANTLYHVRLVYQRRFAAALTTAELTFTTDPAPPLVETLGTPLRTTTTAQLQGRIDPNNSPATYHFEYGEQGPCDSSPCTSTADLLTGSSDSFELAAEEIEGLQPDTTYHYRIVADNGIGGSPVAGSDATVTTRASESPLTHGHFPGPPGSDRAWEQVSMPDSGGNPVGLSQAFSDNGNAAIYGIAGGTPISEAGSLLSIYYTERTASGWHSKVVTPPRAELIGASWNGVFGRGDLSSFVSVNYKEGIGTASVLWRLVPGGQPAKLFQPEEGQAVSWDGSSTNNAFGTSADDSRVVALLKGGSLDPAYPAATAAPSLYDISAGGDPQLLSFLPGETVAACGVDANFGAFATGGTQASHWVSADGSLVFFPSQGDGPCAGGEATSSQLYLRDLKAAQTKLISGPPLSGRACTAGLIKAIPDAAFFWTQTRLAPEDTAPADCIEKGGGGVTGDKEDGDVYRYDLGDGSLKCVTCLVAGRDADVAGTGPTEIAVSEDGSRLYFESKTRLVAGAPDGSPGIYRVNIATGDLAYVASVAPGTPIGANNEDVGLTPDGSVLVFRTNFAGLNPLGSGLDNGGTEQYYRYDDTNRSLVCVTCPRDGAPASGAPQPLFTSGFVGQPNLNAISDDGSTVAFATPIPLLGADQNTPAPGIDPSAGRDVYEWRDGRYLLVTDGLSSWSFPPNVESVSPSGRDVFFMPPPSTPPTRSTPTAASTTPASAAASTSPPRRPPVRWRSARARRKVRPRNRHRAPAPSLAPATSSNRPRASAPRARRVARAAASRRPINDQSRATNEPTTTGGPHDEALPRLAHVDRPRGAGCIRGRRGRRSLPGLEPRHPPQRDQLRPRWNRRVLVRRHQRRRRQHQRPDHADDQIAKWPHPRFGQAWAKRPR